MPATALTPVYVSGLTATAAPVAADATNGNTFPMGADLVVENSAGSAATLKFTPARTGAFDYAEVTLNLAANTKYRINASYFKNAFPGGTVTVTASAATVLLRAENVA
jgi:hypothetical protein